MGWQRQRDGKKEWQRFVFNIAFKTKSATDIPSQLSLKRVSPSGKWERLVAVMARIDARLGSGQ